MIVLATRPLRPRGEPASVDPHPRGGSPLAGGRRRLGPRAEHERPRHVPPSSPRGPSGPARYTAAPRRPSVPLSLWLRASAERGASSRTGGDPAPREPVHVSRGERGSADRGAGFAMRSATLGARADQRTAACSRPSSGSSARWPHRAAVAAASGVSQAIVESASFRRAGDRRSAAPS